MAITETQKSRTIRARDKNPPAPSKPRAKPGPKPKDRPRTAARFERDERQLKEAESTFADVLQTLRRDRCLRGEEATIDELLDPQIEQEDFDSEFLRFAEGEEGTREILEYLKLRDEDEQDEEDLQEPEFQFSKQEALNAVAFLPNIAHHRPDLDVALPLVGQLGKFRSALAQEMEEGKVQTTITSFFK
ncbi:hypothetical protein B0H14DRAFT_3543816 [Mycena olivaceomarginata]|nr:hypothetical protein B0H14DRAFT_3543816 [Mycena olivaceomarginata]